MRLQEQYADDRTFFLKYNKDNDDQNAESV